MPNSFYENKKVLVTGGGGLIGSYVVDLLLDAGAIVTAADNLSREQLGVDAHTIAARQGFTFECCDLTNYKVCRELCSGHEYVLNLAGKVTGIAYNESHQSEMFCENMLLQQNVIRAAAAVGVSRFLQVSTACVYPHDAAVPTPEDEGERDFPEPTNLGYGWAKRMGEQLAKLIANETEMKVAIARPFNTYGPRDNFTRARSHVIPALIQRVLEGHNPLVVYGSGDQSRSFVHARDVAQGMLLITEKYAVADPVNIGHTEEITIRDLTALILELTGQNRRVVFDRSKQDGYARRASDTSKLERVTGGWLPQIRLREGIAELISWYREASSAIGLREKLASNANY